MAGGCGDRVHPAGGGGARGSRTFEPSTATPNRRPSFLRCGMIAAWNARPIRAARVHLCRAD